MIELFLFLLTLLAGPSDLPIQPPDFVVQAAAVAAGEAPSALMGMDAYWGVVCTMRNRMDSPDFPNSVTGVLADYYAPPRTPTDDELRLAWSTLLTPDACEWGDAPRILYAMSEQDRAAHGWPAGDWASVPVVVEPSGTVLQMHFYDQWPGEAR